jgi:hypothetical protein
MSNGRAHGGLSVGEPNRAYFFGAGASKQDRFPLTNELKHGIAWAVLQDPSRFELLAAHLHYLYDVRKVALGESARIWERLRQRSSDLTHTACSQYRT